MTTVENKEPSKQAWRRHNGHGDQFFSSEEAEYDQKKLRALEATRDLYDTQEEYEAKVARLKAQGDAGEEVSPVYNDLASATAIYERHYGVAAHTMGARHAMALALLDQDPPPLTAEDHALPAAEQWKSELDKHITMVKRAYGKPWEALRRLCEEHIKENGTGNYYVPLSVIRALDNKVDEGKEAAAKRRETAAKNRATRAAEAAAS